ncbi:TetR/AcrR family transcriptional regulator [Sphingoaurantiacus capsulatus]|uniref:TetR/AcrR family transcriptional regulator n=1 Tax=Sphingoaurantiacus capsulatus TaxID=1771310 RepID=A0ABV7X8A8_9SPHN
MASVPIRQIDLAEMAAPTPLLTRPYRSRNAILIAARALFRDRPADSVSVEMIAARAGVTRRTVYNQFAGAAELYRATREALVMEVAALLPLGVAADLPPRAALRSYCCLVAQAFADARYAELTTSVVRDGWAAPWLIDAWHRHIRLPVLRGLEAQHQALRTGGDGSRQTAVNLLAAIEAVTVAARLLPGLNADIPDCTPELVDAFLARLCPPAALA